MPVSPDTGGDRVADLDISVPLRFGMGAITKGVLSESNLAGQEFGFFAIDEASVDFSEASDLDMSNQAALYEQSGFTFLDPSGEAVTLYYPLRSDEKYHFYGYAVEGVSARTCSWNRTSERITVTVPVTSTQDILYGKAAGDAVNAAYFRKNPDHVTEFVFEHATAGISFHASLDENFPSGQTVVVKSVEFMDRSGEAELCMADRSDSDNWTGGFFMEQDNSGKTVVVEGISEPVGNEPVQVMEDIYIVPEDGLETSPFAVRVAVDHAGETVVLDLTDVLHRANSTYDVKEYAPGRIYRYRLVFSYSDVDGLGVDVKPYKKQ